MQKIRLKICHIRRNKKGYTLVELLVSFVILAILMTAALAVLTSATGVYAKIKAMNTAQSVSTMLINKIEGEMDGATVYATEDEEINQISYIDKSGHNVVMGIHSRDDSGRNILQLTYDGGSEPWEYSNSTYMDNSIESLTFTPSTNTEQDKSWVTVTLSVTNTRTNYTYTRTKTLRCDSISAP